MALAADREGARANIESANPVVTASLALIVAVAAAYLAAHVVFDWLGRRFLIVSGAEYLVLGVLLGPRISGFLDASVITSLAPVLTLALGWIGMLVGTEFEAKQLVATPAQSFRIAFAESAITALFVGALEFVAIRWLINVPDDTALFAATALGALAVAASGAGVALVARQTNGPHRTVDQLRVSTRINSLVAILVFALALCLNHAPAPTERPLTPTEWAVVTIAIGMLGGLLFHVFLGDTPGRDRLFVALVGGIVLVSGAATYLELSPLLASLCFGAILVNSTPNPQGLVETLARVERPFYFVLLLFAGASWQPSQNAWVALIALYLAARALGKVGGSRLAARLNGARAELGDNWGRALLGQGRVALAIGVSYLNQSNLPLRNVVFTAAVISVLATEFLSARAARWVISQSSPAPRAG
jgi:hypothetical protein